MARSSADSQQATVGSPALLGGLSALLAALTAIATVNGEIGRMFRNHPVWTFAAIALVLIGVLCGLLTQARLRPRGLHRLLVVGSIALVLGTGTALAVEIHTLSQSDRPTISARAEQTGPNVRVTAHVIGAKARRKDQIVVIVYGRRPDGSRGSPIYYAKTGPTTDGDLSQDVQLDVDPEVLGGVYISAVEVSENVLPPNVDCNGYLVADDGSPQTTLDGSTWDTIAFRPNGNPPLVACAVIRFAEH